MRVPTSPPADFVDFVARCGARLHAAAWELTGDVEAASTLVADLLAAAAGRWRTLRPTADDPASRATALAYVGRLFRRKAAAYGDDGSGRLRRARRPGHPAYDSAAVGDLAELAAAAWARARRTRQTRGLVAAGVVVLVVLALLGQPQPAGTTTDEPPPAESAVEAIPTTMPAALDVLPEPHEQLALPRLVTQLPAHITLNRPVGPITAHPMRRALAIFRLPASPLLLLGEDGQIRTVPEDILAAVDVRGGGGDGRLPVSALSPDGSRVALPLTNELAVLDIPTRKVRRFTVPERTRSIVWFGTRWLLAGGQGSSVLIDIESGRSAPSSAEAQTALTPRGAGTVPATPVMRDDPPGSPAAPSPPAGPLTIPGAVELLAVGEPLTAPARVRRHLATPDGVLAIDIALNGELSGWVGPWRGAGFVTEDWAVRDCMPTGTLPRPFGNAALATAAVDPASGRVQRLLVAAGAGPFGPAQALGVLGPSAVLVRPGAVLIRAPGEPGTVNLLAWQPGLGQLYLVATLDREPAMAVADLSSFG